MRLFSLLVGILLTGCQVNNAASLPAPISSLFDYQLQNPAGNRLSLPEAVEQLADADVIMVGELHGHQGIHRFQADLLARLLDQPRPYALAMEQFSRDNQDTIDAYLSGQGEISHLLYGLVGDISYKKDANDHYSTIAYHCSVTH